MNRRQALLGTAAAGTLGVTSTRSARAGEAKPCGRFVHITDVHITPAKQAPQGFAALWDHVNRRKDAAEFVLNTGDSVMAVDGGVTGAKAAEQIALWQAGIKAAKVPVFSSLGNHDVWGGTEPTEAIPAEKKGFALMTGVLGMPAPYYSFDRAGWHFISLNSMVNWPNYGTLSTEHLNWLQADLKATPADKPVVVFAHLPIVSVTSSLYGDSTRKDKTLAVPGAWQQIDCFAISEIFRKHPNVKLCLSGHMHTQDRCDYRGVSYICGGAASGAWWDGAEYGFPPCYGAVTLYDDGRFDYEFVDYGWTARAYKGKKLD